MEFQNYANELIEYLIIGEQRGRLIQYNISEIAKGEIAVLMYLLKEKDGANAYEISRRFDINTSRVAAILNSLCRKEYVKRMSDADDKRKIHVYTTPKGQSFCLQRYNDVLSHVTRMLSELGEKDAKEYVRIMKKITDIFKEMD